MKIRQEDKKRADFRARIYNFSTILFHIVQILQTNIIDINSS